MTPLRSPYPMRLSPADVTALIEEHFPQVHDGTGRLVIETLTDGQAFVRMHADLAMVRPGGTVSGPAMFKLADFAVYVAILGHLGGAGLQAVTTSMTMNFLRRPAPADMLARARLIKVGRRLAVADVELYAEGRADMVAHTTGTYALPPAELVGGI
jgi:uncharacterized protein (TIGR00369 family)